MTGRLCPSGGRHASTSPIAISGLNHPGSLRHSFVVVSWSDVDPRIVILRVPVARTGRSLPFVWRRGGPGADDARGGPR